MVKIKSSTVFCIFYFLHRKHHFPTAERNKQPILEVLKKHLSTQDEKKCLEIASGAGQHIFHFAQHFPNIQFYPSEEDHKLLDVINGYIQSTQITNVKPAKHLDATEPPETWCKGELKQESMDYIYNCNMIHLVAHCGVEGLFRGSSYYLKPDGLLITYGPYADNGILTPDSNVRFNQSIKSINHTYGIRDITLELVPTAKQYNIVLLLKYDMPANNKILVWQKQNHNAFL